jgi:Tfp pilus assembly protein PilW
MSPKSKPARECVCDAGRAAIRGFTLSEMMIGATLGSMVLVAILSSFLFMGRTGANAYNYVGMEQEARRGLERFSEDVRMASGVTWTSNTRVTLRIPQASGSGTDSVIYYYQAITDQSNVAYPGSFMRDGPDPVTGISVSTTLIKNVQTFEFDRWMLGATGQATNDLGTKQLQIRLTVSKTSKTVVAATNLVISARYIMRNK